VVTGEYPLFIMAKCLDHEDSMRLIGLDHEDSMRLIVQLRNLPGVEEVKTQIVLGKINENTSVIIPE